VVTRVFVVCTVVACVLLGCRQRFDVFSPSGVDTTDGGTLTGASFVMAGDAHACAIVGGRAACWGANGSGQCGVAAARSVMPTWVGAPHDVQWTALAGGDSSTCGLKVDGSVWCWGGNDQGQLGQNTLDSAAHPVPLRVPLAGRAVGVTTQFETACAVLENGSAWCWGNNLEGQLGLGEWPPTTDTKRPRALAHDGGWEAVDMGQGHACGLGKDGSLWCWGRNTNSQLGQSGTAQIRLPTRVGTGTDWTIVGAGQDNSCAVKADGTVWCFGLFNEEPGRTDVTPAQRGSGFETLSMSVFHRCGVVGGAWSCFGRNAEGQLGLGNTEVKLDPTSVAGEWRQVSAGRFFTCGLAQDGSVWCSGDDHDGQLGIGPPSVARPMVPVAVRAPVEP
jgi:Regulator of chromosome condensation (RCC1) repeat